MQTANNLPTHRTTKTPPQPSPSDLAKLQQRSSMANEGGGADRGGRLSISGASNLAQKNGSQALVVVGGRLGPVRQQQSTETPPPQPRSPSDLSQISSNRTTANPNQSESGNWAIYLFLGIFLLVLLVLIITLVITKQRK